MEKKKNKNYKIILYVLLLILHFNILQAQESTTIIRSLETHISLEMIVDITGAPLNQEIRIDESPEPIRIKVINQNGYGYEGIQIHFTIYAPPGSEGFSLSIEDTETDEFGVAETEVTIGDKLGTYEIHATSEVPELNSNNQLVFGIFCTFDLISETLVEMENPLRTDLGLREKVNIYIVPNDYFDMQEIEWQITGDGVFIAGGGTPDDPKIFQAGYYQASPSVSCTIHEVENSINFEVYPPQEYVSLFYYNTWEQAGWNIGDDYLGFSYTKLGNIVSNLAPTPVSFFEVDFRENFDPLPHVWPSGAEETLYQGNNQEEFGLSQYHLVTDYVNFGFRPIDYLFDGNNFVYHTIELILPLEYKDESDEWIDWVVTIFNDEFNENSDFKSRSKVYDYEGDEPTIGDWQGPWESPWIPE